MGVWTPNEDAIIRTAIHVGLSSKEIAHHFPNRSIESIRQRKTKLKRTRPEEIKYRQRRAKSTNPKIPWTDAEIEFLKQHPKAQHYLLAKALNRTPSAVKCKRDALGIDERSWLGNFKNVVICLSERQFAILNMIVQSRYMSISGFVRELVSEAINEANKSNSSLPLQGGSRTEPRILEAVLDRLGKEA